MRNVVLRIPSWLRWSASTMLWLGATVWYFTGSEPAFVWALVNAPLILMLLTTRRRTAARD